MTTRVHSTRRKQGFSLLEVMMALALFAAAAVALVETINEVGNITVQARVLRTVEQGLESVLDEFSKTPQMQEREEEIKADDNGISYSVVIKSLDNLKNQDNQVLSGMFGIKVTAHWNLDGKKMESSAETIRYAGMFLPQ